MFKRMSLFLVAVLAAGVMSCSAVTEDPDTITVTSTSTPEERARFEFACKLSPAHWTMFKCCEDGKGPDVGFELNKLGKLALKIYDLEQSLKGQDLETSEELEQFRKDYEAALQPTKWQKFKEVVKACNLYLKCAAAVGLLLEQAL